jgi:hypothetical protein
MRPRLVGLALVITALLTAGCNSADDPDATAATPAATVAETTTTAAAPTTTAAPSTSPPRTTRDLSWHRDAELAVRGCLDDARLAGNWIDLMFDYGDRERVDEIQASCDAAEAQLELEVGSAASQVSFIIEGINIALARAALNQALGDAEPPEYDYAGQASEAEALIP